MGLPPGWSSVRPQSGSGSDSESEDVRQPSPDNEPIRESLRVAHREILRRVFLGEQLKDVADAVGMPYATVRYIVRSPLFQAALAEMQREADGKVIDTAQRMRMERAITDAAEEGIPVALKVMRTSESPGLRAKLAFGFLDRAGMNASRKVEEKREGFREMLERLDEMEKLTSPGTQVTAEIKFSVRKEGEYDIRAGVSPADRARPIQAETRGESTGDASGQSGVSPVSFLKNSLEEKAG